MKSFLIFALILSINLVFSQKLLINHHTRVLSYLHQGEVRNVCDDFYTPENAAVACLELYGNPKVIEYVPS